VSELVDRTISRNQQGQDVESVHRIIRDQERSRPNVFLDSRSDLGICPRQPVDRGVSMCARNRSMPEKLWMRSSGHDTSASVLYVNRTIAFDSGEAQPYTLEALAAHRLDGVAPDFSQMHKRPLFVTRVDFA
jgi:hypothetical protein